MKLTVGIILAAALFLASCGGTPQLTTEQSIDRIMEAYAAPDGPGASVLVMVHDSIIFKRSYGLASVKENIPVTSTTNFRLASVTKQFTAMAVMMLQEQGKLSYDEVRAPRPAFSLRSKLGSASPRVDRFR